MRIDLQHMPKVLQLYLELSQYPILARRIRERMREEIFSRGIINQQAFEQEVREKAIRSQEREGLLDPWAQEPPDMWQERVRMVRDHQTDFYFAYNLPHALFEQILQEVLAKRGPKHEVMMSFNPELAPWDLLFAQAEAFEAQPPEKRVQVQHHLREILVVLIKAMISDQLSFVRVAREYFTVADLKEIRAHRFGRGKIGGKAAGMLLAHKILQRHGKQHGIDVDNLITIPESWYVGTDVFYDFHEQNGLFQYMNQKYKHPEQMRVDYPASYNAYLNSQLPDYLQYELTQMLEVVGNHPLIVRSSSLLEDNFDTSFAGKYDSFFLPNQGTLEENLRDLVRSIIKVYASSIRPDALIYRERMGLTDFDERMGVLIQKVEGRRNGRYFYPDFAGVGFSHNPYVWNKRIDRDMGLLRIVAGFGTRAVDRVGSDYPRMVALSHPTLRPNWGVRNLKYYSQHLIDVIDLEENTFKTVPITEAIGFTHPAVRAIVSIDQGDFVQPMKSLAVNLEPSQLVITYDNLLSSGPFVETIRESLQILEEAYGRPVDIEFAGEIKATHPRPQPRISLLQCRALSRRGERQMIAIPDNIPRDDILFTADRQVPMGCVDNIRYIVYVDPGAYAHIPEPYTRVEIGQVVGRLNQALADERFILIGPGRWGTSNIQLGVKVSYVDIFNTQVLIEVAVAAGKSVAEVSYGTHFFQDLVEAEIYPLPLYPGDPDTVYREDLFKTAPNMLTHLLPGDERFAPYIKVIDVPAIASGRHMSIVMNSEEDRAIGFFTGTPCCDTPE